MIKILTGQEKTAIRFLVGIMVVGLITGFIRDKTDNELDPDLELELAEFATVSEKAFSPESPDPDKDRMIPDSSDEINQININKAGKSELMNLPKIGPVTAERIIRFRDDYGHFSELEDLTKVKGIGAKTIEKIRPYVEF